MDPAKVLRAWGFEVQEFSTYHFRVDDRIDFWLPRGKWWDRQMGDRGRKPIDQIPYFIATRLGGPAPTEVSKEDFVARLTQIGWSKKEAEKAWTDRK